MRELSQVPRQTADATSTRIGSASIEGRDIMNPIHRSIGWTYLCIVAIASRENRGPGVVSCFITVDVPSAIIWRTLAYFPYPRQ